VDGVYNDILSIAGLNALIFNDPYAKLCFTAMLASRCCLGRVQQQEQQGPPYTSKKKVSYIDLDTTFSAYVKAGLLLKELTIATAAGRTATHDATPLIIEDIRKSITIYLPTEGNFESILNNVINSIAESCIVIFDSVNSFYNLYYKILATSMIRYKKSKDWIQSPSSNRLLRGKSVVKLYVEMLNENDLSVHIISHPARPQETVIFQNQGIKL
jgi:hypothetical protein